jgi:hypothetical protein
MYVAALRRADHSSKGSYRLCKKYYGTEEEARAQKRAVEPLMKEWTNISGMGKRSTLSIYHGSDAAQNGSLKAVFQRQGQ